MRAIDCDCELLAVLVSSWLWMLFEIWKKKKGVGCTVSFGFYHELR